MQARLTLETAVKRVKRVVLDLLKEAGAAAVPESEDLTQYGFDSMMTLELVAGLEAEFECLLEIEEIANCRSTVEVATYVSRVLALEGG